MYVDADVEQNKYVDAEAAEGKKAKAEFRIYTEKWERYRYTYVHREYAQD